MPRKAKKQKSRGVVDTNVLVADISGFRKPYVRGKNPSADMLYKWAEKGNFVWLVIVFGSISKMRDRFSTATLNVYYPFHKLNSERQIRKNVGYQTGAT